MILNFAYYKTYYNCMKKIFIQRIKAFLISTTLYKRYLAYKNRERYIHYGNEYPDKTFYVIGQDDQVGGMWWLINKAVMHIAYANEKGYIPVVDLQNFKTQYSNDEIFGKVNIWEYYLDQPCGFSLDKNGKSPHDISHAQNIIICKKEPAPFPKFYMGNTDFYENSERLDYFRSIFKQYIHFNSQTINYFESQKERLFRGRKMCGVLCRGTDYLAQKPKGHPIQPNPEDVIIDTKSVMNELGCDGVFLATEDLDILNLFIKAFGDKLSYIDQPRLSKKDINSGELLANSKKRLYKITSSYEDGLQYLVSTYLLSQCNCFLSGKTGGCKGVLLMTASFEYYKVYNLGFYE